MAILFSRRLTGFDIERRLTVPRYHLSEFPAPARGQALKLKVKDEKGCVWNFHCSLETTIDAISTRLVFTAGWLQFARSENLSVGDTVYFHKQLEQDAAEPPYEIVVKKCNSK